MVFVLCAALSAVDPAVGSTQPDVEPVAADAPAPEGAPPPPPDGAVVSTPPATLETPGGWTLTMSAEKETQAAIPPLTTALSSREYVVGGTFHGELAGPDDGGEPPSGLIEVGYEIGCGIDMSTSNGVSLTGTVGLNPSLGVIGTDVISPLPDGILPGIGGNIGGGVTVGLKPGLINVVPVTEKEFTGTKPWVMVSNFRVKIDGCVGQSFIRSYALLTHETEMSEAVLAWYGTTKMI
ncbi:MspA family porin [Mycolicibacterium sp. S2-37]|uniref:MspA family porin n=1 Tax=Mycolicibacterium sp. S2-37 TaxID=2810297 RepID=UPI001A944016|nr:MspA family porin [Mycolicibacterium sp. S2-37]MBO0677915.1 MspA family porin [Mycolicibacterium sp. S2-37]